MGKYKGSRPVGICDRNGKKYPKHELVPEYEDGKWNGLLVHFSELDPDHPQNFLEKLELDDPRPVRHARPDAEETPLTPAEQAAIDNLNNNGVG